MANFFRSKSVTSRECGERWNQKGGVLTTKVSVLTKQKKGRYWECLHAEGVKAIVCFLYAVTAPPGSAELRSPARSTKTHVLPRRFENIVLFSVHLSRKKFFFLGNRETLVGYVLTTTKLGEIDCFLFLSLSMNHFRHSIFFSQGSLRDPTKSWWSPHETKRIRPAVGVLRWFTGLFGTFTVPKIFKNGVNFDQVKKKKKKSVAFLAKQRWISFLYVYNYPI